MTDLSQQRIEALGQQLATIEKDVADLQRQTRAALAELGTLYDYAELHRRLDDAIACMIDGTQPELSAGVQARLVRHKQEKP